MPLQEDQSGYIDRIWGRSIRKALEKFDVTLSQKQSGQECVRAPIRDDAGKYVGQAEWTLDTNDMDANADRLHGILHRCESLMPTYSFLTRAPIVYNADRAAQSLRRIQSLIIVANLPTVWWLWCCGFDNVVAWLAPNIRCYNSKINEKILAQSRHYLLLSGTDSRSEEWAIGVFTGLGTLHPVRWGRAPGLSEASTLTGEEIVELIRSMSTDEP